MSVYYKFNSELNFSHVGFDGLHISVIDLKRAIFHQKRLGKTSDFDLLISNAQTKEEYIEDDCLIPKNTSLIVARVPISSNHKKWDHQSAQTTTNFHANEQQHITSASAENVDLFKMNGSEEDKIQAMMTQSTLDYDPSNYQRVRGLQQTGEVPSNYRCHRCHKSGHWIKNCPQNPAPKEHHHSKVRVENKKMTGIPRSLRENPPNNSKETDTAPIPEVRREIPEDLICSICKNLVQDAVMIPCCGSSFCDECIRTALLESDENECPECSEKGTSPGSLFPNRYLRSAVKTFISEVNNSALREKQPETTNVQSDDATIATTEADSETKEEEEEVNEQPPLKEEEQHRPDLEDEHFNKNNDECSDDSDVEDNIYVKVPPASQQSGPGFKFEHQSNNYQNSAQDWQSPSATGIAPEKLDLDNQMTPPDEPLHHYDNSYDLSQKSSLSAPSNSYQIENMNKGFQSSSSMMNNPQGPYHHQQQPQVYNTHPQPNMHGPPHHPQFAGPRYPGMHMHQQSNFYGPPHHNIRPMRYDHRHMHENKYHHPHHHPMHMGMRDNYDTRYQSSTTSTNLANIVSHNIQQRFGTGIIDDPLEAFNKIMREKEMRRDRFKRSPIRSRSPLRQYSPHRPKSPIRRRKRSRSFSSSRSYSKSRSRSNDRHFTKENTHRKDFRSKYRSTSDRRRRSSERSRSLKTKEKSSFEEKSVKKLTSEETNEHHQLQTQQQEEDRQEIHKSLESIPTVANKTVDNQQDEPPPPGEEDLPNLSSNETETKIPEKEQILSDIQPDCEEEKGSSDDTKHNKKSREKKKHKKEIKNRKKKKRDRKEKRSAQHSRNNTPEIEIDQKTKVNVDENNHSSTPPPANESNDQLSFNENDDNKSVLYEPEISKWERDDILEEKNEKVEVNDNVITNTEVITSDIIKRAENVVVSKSSLSNENNNKANASESLSSVIKKIDSDKKYESFQVTVPADSCATRSIEIQRDDHRDLKKNNNDSLPQRTSIKDRLGKKIDTRKRSHSRDRKSAKKDYNSKRNYHMSSTISSVNKTSGRNDKRSARRSRSRSPEYRRHKRSRTSSPNRGIDRQDRKQKEKTSDDKVESSSKHSNVRQEREKRSRSVSYSPRKHNHKDSDKKRSRSRSNDSRKYRKKKKKEKKTKKHKSKERK